MSTSQSVIVGIVGTLAVMAGAFYLGTVYEKSRFVSTPLIVTERVNVDSIKNVLLVGKVDSIELSDAYDLIADLRNRSPRIKYDTIIVTRNVKIPIYSADTTLATTGHVVTTDEEDTTSASYQTNVHMKLQWFPPPFQVFRIENLSIDTMRTTFTRKRSIITETGGGFSFSLEPVFGGGGHGALVGGFIDIDNWAVGGLAIAEEKPIWMVKHRIVIFR